MTERRLIINKAILKPCERGRRNNRLVWPGGYGPGRQLRRLFKKIRTRKRRYMPSDMTPGI